MTVSALTTTDLANYLRMESDDIDALAESELSMYLTAATSYAVQYTGRTAEELDSFPDVAIAVLCLAADYYSDRDMVRSLKGTGTTTQNAAVQAILDLYAVNLLPEESTSTLPSSDDDDDDDEEDEEDSEEDEEDTEE